MRTKIEYLDDCFQILVSYRKNEDGIPNSPRLNLLEKVADRVDAGFHAGLTLPFEEFVAINGLSLPDCSILLIFLRDNPPRGFSGLRTIQGGLREEHVVQPRQAWPLGRDPSTGGQRGSRACKLLNVHQSKALDLFDAYEANLMKVDPLRTPVGNILCPLCLGPIARSDELVLEHIVPRHSTVEKEQKTPQTKLAVADARSGVTLTCKQCNGKKGRELDFPLRRLIAGGAKEARAYTYRSGTSILIYAYLFTFSVFGYEYIFKAELEEIRKQFEDPDGRHTEWLEYAEVHPDEIEQPIVANSWGYPFVMGGRPGPYPLEVFFWRFRSKLPSIYGIKHAVGLPASMLAQAGLPIGESDNCGTDGQSAIAPNENASRTESDKHSP